MNPRELASIVGCSALALVSACSSGGAGDDATSDGGSGGMLYGADASASTSGSTSGSSGHAGSSGGDAGGDARAPDGGDAGDGGASGCSGAAADPAAAATVSGYVDKLPAGNRPTGATRSAVIDAVIKSCDRFGPSSTKDAGWDRKYCWAHLLSAIEKESGYDVTSTVKDAYAMRTIGASKANDPTVGLLQIRFSSTFHDVVQYGREDSLSCIGCPLPSSFAAHKAESGDSAFWAVTGPTANLSLMENVACNVGLGAFYYYVFATENGKTSTPTYVADACAGQGAAGNLVTGLLSHLEGPGGGKGKLDAAGVSALQGSNANAYQYVTSIKTSFDGMVGAVAGTHPFFLTLSPDPSTYCR